MGSANQPFTWNASSKTLTGGLLVPGGGDIEIEGHTLSGISNSELLSMEVAQIDGGIYKYQVRVLGKDGLFESGWDLEFTDETDDVYKLGISSPVKESHYVDFNSERPAIKKVYMSQ